MINLTTEQSAKVFKEWDQRWRDRPEWFTSTATHLLKETASEYGPRAAAYFEAIARDLLFIK